MIIKDFKKDFDLFLKENKLMGYIDFEENNFQIVLPYSKSVKIPKNKDIINLDWFNKRLSKNSSYNNLSNVFKKLLNNDGFNVYCASYGIGVFVPYNCDFNKTLNKLKDYLKLKEIEFKTEFSKENYVYRFKISKKENNINKIKNLRCLNE